MVVSLFYRVVLSATLLVAVILIRNFIRHQSRASSPRIISMASSNSKDLPGENTRIFFHETGDKGFLNMEQTCCVESAAFNNPTRKIYLFLSDSTAATHGSTTAWREVLSNYGNVEIEYINFESYFTGTPLESWYRNGSWVKSPFRTAHLSDYIRVVTALKGGGMYLDLDMLVLRPLKENLFWNFLVFENHKNLVANAFFHLEHKHPLTETLVSFLTNDYRPDDYIYHGPGALTKALRQHCGIATNFIRVSKCNNVTLMPHRMIDPFGPYLWETYLEPVASRPLKRAYRSYAIHHFRSFGTGERAINMSSNQLFGVLAQKNCPITAERSRRL